MSERVRTVEHRRGRRSQCAKDAPPGEQVADERFPARDQLICEHVPWPGLETPLAEQRGQLAGPVGAHGEVILENDPLPVEQEALAGARGIVEQLVDQLDESLPEAANRVIPLPVPVRVRDDMDFIRWRGGHRRSFAAPSGGCK
jgi:hypothetical protein